MNTPTSNYEKAVQVYEDGGVDAVFQAVRDGFIHADSYRDCIPCEMRTPHEGDTCLVCGTENPGQHFGQVIDHKMFFERADDLWLWLEENQITSPVTLTLHLGE